MDKQLRKTISTLNVMKNRKIYENYQFTRRGAEIPKMMKEELEAIENAMYYLTIREINNDF